MIQSFVDRFMARKDDLRRTFGEKHPDSYIDVVRAVVDAVRGPEYSSEGMDPARIHQIDDGDYQGTLVFVIGAGGYQPNDYWYVKVYYGSCSGCDTLQSIRGYRDEPITEEQVDEYMTLALHIVQGLKKMGSD